MFWVSFSLRKRTHDPGLYTVPGSGEADPLLLVRQSFRRRPLLATWKCREERESCRGALGGSGEGDTSQRNKRKPEASEQ